MQVPRVSDTSVLNSPKPRTSEASSQRAAKPPAQPLPAAYVRTKGATDIGTVQMQDIWAR